MPSQNEDRKADSASNGHSHLVVDHHDRKASRSPANDPDEYIGTAYHYCYIEARRAYNDLVDSINRLTDAATALASHPATRDARVAGILSASENAHARSSVLMAIVESEYDDIVRYYGIGTERSYR